jgi:carotenoid cleavage dioxygenase-like enzyme
MTAGWGAGTRYGYSAVIAENFETRLPLDHGLTNVLLKHDLATTTVALDEFPAGCTAGEAVSVTSASDGGADDGSVMTLVQDPDCDAADLVILAAQDFHRRPGRPRPPPRPVPLGEKS